MQAIHLTNLRRQPARTLPIRDIDTARSPKPTSVKVQWLPSPTSIWHVPRLRQRNWATVPSGGHPDRRTRHPNQQPRAVRAGAHHRHHPRQRRLLCHQDGSNQPDAIGGLEPDSAPDQRQRHRPGSLMVSTGAASTPSSPGTKNARWGKRNVWSVRMCRTGEWAPQKTSLAWPYSWPLPKATTSSPRPTTSMAVTG